MATNRTRVRGRQLTLTPTYVTGGGATSAGKSGDPCLVGQLPGVLLEDQATTSPVTIDTLGVYALSVHSIDGAIAEGAKLYYVPGNTPPLSDDVDGTNAVEFGIALAAVGNGATATIDVRLKGC